MDADVMITIAFTLEVFLFALVAGVVIARRTHKAREAPGDRGTEPREPKAMGPGLPAIANELRAADASELMGGPAPRAMPRARS